MDLAIFHNDYTDLVSLGMPQLTIDPAPAPEHFTYHFPYVNGVGGTTDGFELGPDWNPTSWWQIKATYSYLNLDLKLNPNSPDTGTVTADEGSSPHNQASFQSRFSLPRGFEIDQTYRYVSALPAQLVKGYSTADVRFAWHATHEVDVSIAANNLLQPRHAEFANDPGPIVGIKRSIYANITWRLTGN
jgi:iron complex outermembrane receptor protein